MSVPGAASTRVDLATWDAVTSRLDDAYELVEGVPTMSPGEDFGNRAAGLALGALLRVHREERFAVATDVDVTVQEVPLPTVRRPDVVVATREVLRPGGARRLTAREVLLVAEVVSESSVERDLVTKRREYAAAGIPAYLVVDLRTEPGRLMLYGARDAQGMYVDVAPTSG